MAESRCSTVETRTPPSETSVVHRCVSPTFSTRAGISTGSVKSIRRNTIPEFAAAGRRVR